MVNLGAEKMSKSLGNVLSIREIVKRHEPDALRLWMLGTHYRNMLEWSEERVGESARALQRLRALIDEAERLAPAGPGGRYRTAGIGAVDVAALSASVPDPDLRQTLAPRVEAFVTAMDDDFNTPASLAALFDLSRDLHRYRDAVSRGDKPKDAFIRGVDALLDLGQRALGLFERGTRVAGPTDDIRVNAERLMAEREAARQRRDWRRADELRAELQALGVTIVDTPSGPQLRWSAG
jgi:cysteinyl-tRNA synthetase